MGAFKGPGRIRQESPPSPNLARPLKARLFNYDINDDTLKPEHKDWLAEHVIPIVRRCPHTKVELRGTASRTGSDQYNLKLSERRAKGISNFLASNGVAPGQVTFKGLGESPARSAGKRDGTESDEDRAVLVDLIPPSNVNRARFDRVFPTLDEDGFDPAATPRFLTVPAFHGSRRTLELNHGESLRLRTSRPDVVKIIDPETNRPVDEIIVSGDTTLVAFDGGVPGIAFIVAEGVNGGRRQLLELHSLLHKEVKLNVFIVKDSKGRLPVNRSRPFVDSMVKSTSKLFRDQANISIKINRFEQLDVPIDLGDPVTNAESSAGKNFHNLSDMIKAPERLNLFLVWEWRPDDGDADAEVNKIGDKFCIFEDNLVPGSTPGRVLGHEIGHLLTLTHDNVVKNVLMFGGVGLTSGRLRKGEILKARRGI